MPQNRRQSAILNPMPQPSSATARRQAERRRQVRGLLLLGVAILLFSLVRAGIHNVFTPAGWWHLW
jgi:hypothetical protein